MAWNISERFPSWGETGEFPAAGFFYEGGDQVNEKHLDALWNGINGLEEDVQAALNDIDNDADGTVDEADYALNADQLDGNDASAFDNYQSWTLRDSDGTATQITSGETVDINGGSDIDTNTSNTGGTTVIDINHQNTSNQNDISVSGTTVISDLNFDTNGHTTFVDTQIRSIDDWQNSGDSSQNNVDADTVDGQDAGDLTTSNQTVRDESLVWSEGWAPNFGG